MISDLDHDRTTCGNGVVSENIDGWSSLRPACTISRQREVSEDPGMYFAERNYLEVINLRIGWLLSQDELRDL